MKKFSAFVCLALSAGVSHAAFVNSQVASNAYISKSGYDIAWANPCSANANDTCGVIDLSVQSSYGWKVMSSTLFAALNISASDFVFAGANAEKTSGWLDALSGANVQNINNTTPADDVAVATPWFSQQFNFIDWDNGVDGLWSFSDVNGSRYYDTLVYRVSENGGPLPEPTSLALLGIALLGLGATRRKKLAFGQ